MTEPLLWNLQETAHQLGGVSVRTVRRMIDSGELESVRVRRSVRVVVASVHNHIDKHMEPSNTQKCVKLGERKKGVKRSWHLNAKTHRTGGSLSQISAEKELNDLLEQ